MKMSFFTGQSHFFCKSLFAGLSLFRGLSLSLSVFAVGLVLCLSSPLQAQKKDDPVANKPVVKPEQTLDQKTISIKSGRGKAQLCTRCHGRLGMLRAVKSTEFGGTVEGFVIKELIDFRQGVRSHAVMNSIAQTLSDKDISDIAAWYNAISLKP